MDRKRKSVFLIIFLNKCEFVEFGLWKYRISSVVMTGTGCQMERSEKNRTNSALYLLFSRCNFFSRRAFVEFLIFLSMTAKGKKLDAKIDLVFYSAMTSLQCEEPYTRTLLAFSLQTTHTARIRTYTVVYNGTYNVWWRFLLHLCSLRGYSGELANQNGKQRKCGGSERKKDPNCLASILCPDYFFLLKRFRVEFNRLFNRIPVLRWGFLYPFFFVVISCVNEVYMYSCSTATVPDIWPILWRLGV